MIPETFEQWKHCIVHDCKIRLDGDFAASRLTVYQDSGHPETRKFAALYGESHLQNIITWLKRI